MGGHQGMKECTAKMCDKYGTPRNKYLKPKLGVFVIDLDNKEWSVHRGMVVELVSLKTRKSPEMWMVDFGTLADGNANTYNYPKDRLFGLEESAKDQCLQFNIEQLTNSSDHSESEA